MSHRCQTTGPTLGRCTIRLPLARGWRMVRPEKKVDNGYLVVIWSDDHRRTYRSAEHGMQELFSGIVHSLAGRLLGIGGVQLLGLKHGMALRPTARLPRAVPHDSYLWLGTSHTQLNDLRDMVQAKLGMQDEWKCDNPRFQAIISGHHGRMQITTMRRWRSRKLQLDESTNRYQHTFENWKVF